MSEVTKIIKEYQKIVDDLQSDNMRYYMALSQSSMLLQNRDIDEALQTIKTALREE